MDDVPAGPASPGPRRPSLSVVIPVHNGGRDFERCLRRLRDSHLADFELIVVNDGSTDDSAAVAERAGAIVVRSRRPRARPPPATAAPSRPSAPLGLLPRRRRRRPSPRPSIGRWRGSRPTRASPPSSARTTTRRQAPGLVSQYRNLLHHFVHQQGEFEGDIRPVRTFWTGCGMIRREVFLAFGGFDPRLYPRPAIEDIELGYRLTPPATGSSWRATSWRPT